MKLNLKNQEGFTLIEIIVSLAIFTIVAVIAVGAFLKIIDANKKSQTLKTAINNVNFALESMTREMRVGSDYTCFENPPSTVSPSVVNGGSGNNCSAGQGRSSVYFKSSRPGTTGSCNLIFGYWFDDAEKTIKKVEQTDCGDSLSSSNFVPVISKDTVIDEHVLAVTNESGSSGPQPKVFVRIKGHAGAKKQNATYFDVQTTVSQRSQF